MEVEIQQDKQQTKENSHLTVWIVVALISAWIIALGILGAGWLISKQLSMSAINTNTDTAAAQPASQKQALSQISFSGDEPVIGGSDAKVTIVEFADFQCPFCGEWQKNIYPQLKSEYINTNKVKFVFWDYAFLGNESSRAAEAAWCAKDQNKFWEYHDALFANQKGENEGTFSDIQLKNFAAGIRINTQKFNDCFDNNVYKERVMLNTQRAGEYGVEATPTIFVNNKKYEGVMPWNSFKKIIDSELAK